ncbi:coiled-coil domain-containing protein 97 [Danaus plexippus]|uniref:coiled-coil domain-containing protein 97 n=1 Tax=Danaus plexippus TaxID=13037 RepID=UPI002AB1A116|nr:coiled-coil domain-containing protein 97 [Danaus plexippus]
MATTLINQGDLETVEEDIDPILDIIDYLVRCSNIRFKNSHPNTTEVHTNENISAAYDLYKKSPTQFLMQFGKYLSPNHLKYFENVDHNYKNAKFKQCLDELKIYHSTECSSKRIRNRRYKAMQRMKVDSDYFSEKQMMYRNPLLYEQLIGQFLTDEEIKERDAVDSQNLTFLGMILDTVDRNEMREIKNKQLLMDEDNCSEQTNDSVDDGSDDVNDDDNKHWGGFDIPDTKPEPKPQDRPQCMINANERNLLREEFLQEMYSSFIEGRDINFDYNSVDQNEEYDDLDQISRDAEDKYFDSEDNDVTTLEEHMALVHEYGRKNSSDSANDPLDVFMQHISNKLQ